MKIKVKVIADFFKSFIQEYRKKLGVSKEYDMVKKIREIEKVYF